MKIRPFEAEDAASVAALWQYWFKDKTLVPDPRLIDLVRRIYVQDPNVDGEVRSLVAEDDGKVQGFLGVSVMPVTVDGRSAKMAGVFPSVVAPDASAAVASLLLRKFLAGPQVFTFSDGGHVKFERIWNALGGQIAQLASLRWVRLLRPLEVSANFAVRGPVLGPLGPVLRVLARGGDRVVRPLAGSRLIVPANSGGQGYTSEPLTPAVLAEFSETLRVKSRLRTIYSEEHSCWQFDEMAKIVELGEFTARLVREENGTPVGWFVYYMKSGGVSRVFAIEADDKYLPAVTDVLISDADARGAGVLIGRVEPRLRTLISDRASFVYAKGSLQMIHSSDPTLMAEAQQERLAFNRLQGENWYWWALDSGEIP